MGPRAPRVLIVDDDRMLVALLERGLAYEGFDVRVAHSGTEALARARDEALDVVLLDIGMPDEDGFTVLAELRRTSDVPVVMLTARDEVTDKVGALDSGADDYVAKPFDLDELMARMRAVLRRRGSTALDRVSYQDPVHRPGQPRGHPGVVAANGVGLRHASGVRRRRCPHRTPAPQIRRARADPHRARGRLSAARRAMTIRLRLAAAFTILVASILVVLGVVTYQLLRHNLLSAIERDVAARATNVAATAAAAPYNLDTFGAPDLFLQITGPAGDTVARSGNLGDRTLPLSEAARGGQVVEERVAGRPLFLTAAQVT
ncbi:response regulator transcription factor, partial [Actinokineospora sp.]|uniref:response regulator transcription factor n=1 Tax=Actinokineospora sp. TaxID=1872133 RepID=UPI003D6A97FE